MPNDLILSPEGAVIAAPEPLEAPPAHSPDLLRELIEQERQNGPERMTIPWRLDLADWDSFTAPPGALADSSAADRLTSYAPAAHELIERFMRAAADTRGAWGDPRAIGERLTALETETVNALVAHYAATRSAAAAFVAANRPPRPTPDDAVVLELADAVVRNFGPVACLEWFSARYAEGHPSWPLLHEIVDRLALRPPAHLNTPAYSEAFAALAAQPCDDPFARAREARALAAGVVRAVREIVLSFAVSGGAASV